MKALVRDLKNDVWEVAEITRIRKCIFFPYGGDVKWWSEAIPYSKYKHLEGTMMSMNKRIFITEKDLNKNDKQKLKNRQHSKK